MKRVDETGFGNLVVVQEDDCFCYGVDAVILADFAKANKYDVVADLCSGNGIIPFIMAHKYNCKSICGVEFQKDSVDLANEGIEKNREELASLGTEISFVQADVLDIKKLYDAESFSVVTCNPPYFEEGNGVRGAYDKKHLSRFESTAGLEDFIKAASYLLENKGSFYMIHRPERLCDIIAILRKNHLEPKLMRFVSDTAEVSPRMVMIAAVKNGGKELKILPNLVIHGDVSGYSEEIQNIYER